MSYNLSYIEGYGDVEIQFPFTAAETRINKEAQDLLKMDLELQLFNMETALGGLETALNYDSICYWTKRIAEVHNWIVAMKEFGFPIWVETTISGDKLKYEFNRALVKSVNQEFGIYERGMKTYVKSAVHSQTERIREMVSLHSSKLADSYKKDSFILKLDRTAIKIEELYAARIIEF